MVGLTEHRAAPLLRLKIASSLFSVGRNIRLLLHRTTVPTWSVFLGSADRGGFFVPA
jgi:hypothetical protein